MHRGNKERLKRSILEQNQGLQRKQQTRSPQHKLQQGKSQQIVKIRNSPSQLYFFSRTAKGKQAVSNLQTPTLSRRKPPSTAASCPAAEGWRQQGGGVGHLHPLIPYQGHRYLLCASADASCRGKASACRRRTWVVITPPHPTFPARAGIQALWVGSSIWG